ncbi:MAG: hypothetical protein ACXADB_05825 [Candidatus Hermodarchaeia archaeon]|jgi:hypothetical protein
MIPPKNPDWIAGFKACLDLIRHRIAEADTVEEVIETIQSIEAAVTEKQVAQLLQELALL